MMKLTIQGNVPSQKNRKKIATNNKTGKPFIMSEKSVTDWKKMAILELKQQFRGYVVTGYPIDLNLVFYFDNKRRHDLDNAAAGVLDALTAAEVIQDDNVNFVSCLVLQYGGIDKTNPRVEIYIDD